MKERRQPKGWGKLLGAFALAGLAFALQTVTLLLAFGAYAIFTGRFEVDVDGVPLSIIMIGELAGGLFALLFVVALGGRSRLAHPPGSIRFGLRLALAVFVVDVLLLGIDALGLLSGEIEFSLSETWYTDVIVLAVLCLGVGMFEEGLFRGLVLNGLLARMGTSKRGVIWALVLSSFLFGLAHVFPITEEVTGLNVVQYALKTLQTGIIGFVFGVVALRTRSLWPSIAAHALMDYLLMFPSVGLMGEPLSTDYAFTGEEGVAIAVMYAVVSALYLPALLRSVRELRAVPAPDRGAFWRVRTVADAKTQGTTPAAATTAAAVAAASPGTFTAEDLSAAAVAPPPPEDGLPVAPGRM